MWHTPLGGPPRDLPRGPRVSESSEKNYKNSQKLYKNCTCIKIPQIITLTSILGHFGHWGGPRRVKIFMGGVVGFFSEARALVFFLNILNWSIEEVLGGGVIILICLDDTKTLLTTQKQSR